MLRTHIGQTMKKFFIILACLSSLGFGFSQLIISGPQSFAKVSNLFAQHDPNVDDQNLDNGSAEKSGSESSSRILAANLKAAGFKRPRDSDAHHMVAGNAPAAARARAVLQKYSIDINDQINGVFLPSSLDAANPYGSAVHSTVHTNQYFEIVNQMLESARDELQVKAALGQIRRDLLAGGL